MRTGTAPLRLLLVDDEALARLRLRQLLADEPGAEVVGEAADTDDAMAQLHALARSPAGTPDALLLDIRLPGPGAHAGLKLAAALQALPRPPAVVFVTAHGEHALRAFELDAVDYLTKPVRRERLAAALQRLRLRRAAGGGDAAAAAVAGVVPGGVADADVGGTAQAGAGPLRPPAARGAPAEPALVVSDRGRVLRVPLSEVLYLRAGQKLVTLRTATASHLLDESLTELEQRLAALQALVDAAGAPPRFLRVHRNALVAVHAVRALERREPGGDGGADAAGEGDAAADGGADGVSGWAVRVAPGDEWLAVSRRQVAAVRAVLQRQAGA